MPRSLGHNYCYLIRQLNLKSVGKFTQQRWQPLLLHPVFLHQWNRFFLSVWFPLQIPLENIYNLVLEIISPLTKLVLRAAQIEDLWLSLTGMTGHFLIIVWDLCTRKLVSTSFLKVGVAYWMLEYSFVLQWLFLQFHSFSKAWINWLHCIFI